MATEKPMSSRLAGMKFMARYVAGAGPSQKSEPAIPEGPPNKRARYSSGYNQSSPATPSADQLAINAAQAEVDERRSIAIDRQAAEAGETRWELSVRDVLPRAHQELRVVHAGFAELDSGDVDEGEEDDAGYRAKTVPGRMTFGKKPPTPKRARSDSSSEEEDDEDDGDSDDSNEDPADTLIRQAQREAARRAREDRHAKKRAATAESDRLAEKRRKKDVNLNRVTSISNAGASPSGRSNNNQVKCFGCGGKHKRFDCPKAGRR
ncbi:hypothetical protein EJ08DRAFT_16165 [Tothia fuscella]|uniref:CCHC-type domain-containing protein n=1 Tax=Tothia fuscella TaxID=1048955 RepID=A0A9P4P4G9_9PEZI|nr:hypothetical protein EJ08DRAFT_16165 [Tothia fuscella]